LYFAVELPAKLAAKNYLTAADFIHRALQQCPGLLFGIQPALPGHGIPDGLSVVPTKNQPVRF
jgi:hypothetical protein